MELVYFALVMVALSLSCEALHILHFRTITEEMKRMMHDAAYPEDDPRKLEDPESRQKMCDEVLSARQYTVMNSHSNKPGAPSASERIATQVASNFQRLKSTSREALPFDQGVAYYKNKGNWVKQTLRLIQCVGNRNQHWFVGFDQSESRAYLVERFEYSYNTILYKWIAIIEEGGMPDLDFPGPRAQERMFQYFVNQVKSDSKKKNLQKVSLCFLSLNEHGRLCSAVAQSLTARLQPRELTTHNYINTGQKRCSAKQIELSEKEIIPANVIQCSINRKRENPQFYVLSDRTVKGAVYILKRKGPKKHVLDIVNRILDINVLLEVVHKENVKKFRRKVTRLL